MSKTTKTKPRATKTNRRKTRTFKMTDREYAAVLKNHKKTSLTLGEFIAMAANSAGRDLEERYPKKRDLK